MWCVQQNTQKVGNGSPPYVQRENSGSTRVRDLCHCGSGQGVIGSSMVMPAFTNSMEQDSFKGPKIEGTTGTTAFTAFFMLVSCH